MLFEERLGGEESRLMHLVPARLVLTVHCDVCLIGKKSPVRTLSSAVNRHATEDPTFLSLLSLDGYRRPSLDNQTSGGSRILTALGIEGSWDSMASS
jgi:hypothetical protein